MGVSEKAVLSCTAYPPARVSRRGGIEVLDAGAFMGNHCEFVLEKRRITRIPPRFEYQWRTHASGAVYCFETSWEKEPSAGELRFLRKWGAAFNRPLPQNRECCWACAIRRGSGAPEDSMNCGRDGSDRILVFRTSLGARSGHFDWFPHPPSRRQDRSFRLGIRAAWIPHLHRLVQREGIIKLS
jgi:hypothetical protein